MSENEVVLGEPGHWKAISHPLRLAILRALNGREMTNEELAAAVGVASGALHYHTKRLLDAGFITLAGTRKKGPLTEKLYRLTTSNYRIPLTEDGSAPPLYAILAHALEVYENTWRAREEKEFFQFGFGLQGSYSEETEAEMRRDVQHLLAKYAERRIDSNKPGSRILSISMLAHRVSDPVDE